MKRGIYCIVILKFLLFTMITQKKEMWNYCILMLKFLLFRMIQKGQSKSCCLTMKFPPHLGRWWHGIHVTAWIGFSDAITLPACVQPSFPPLSLSPESLSSYLFHSTPWLVSLCWLCHTPAVKTDRNIQFLVTYRNSTMLFTIYHHPYTVTMLDDHFKHNMTISLPPPQHWLLFTGSLLNPE